LYLILSLRGASEPLAASKAWRDEAISWGFSYLKITLLSFAMTNCFKNDAIGVKFYAHKRR